MSYNKRVWANGDLITKEGINNIEDGIYNAHSQINTINNKVEENTTDTNTAIQDISDIKLQIGTEELTTTSKKIKGSINELDSQIKDIENNTGIKLISDIDSTNYKEGNIINIEEIRKMQNINIGLFFQKIRKGTLTKITCIGDSLTYGQDTVSDDKRDPDSSTCPDGSAYYHTRAGVTYPEALETFLNTIYGDIVTVVNRGYSGDYVKRGYERWCTKHDSDLSICMYGTNDSRATYVPEEFRGNITKYIEWYEQLIIREILWGKGVIILTPPKLKATKGDVNIDIFRNALYQLGEKYGVPVIDSEGFLANYASCFSDDTHMNTLGYKIFASKITCILNAETLYNPMHISNGSILLTRPTIDNFSYNGNTGFPTSTNSFAPNETSDSQGIIASISANKDLIYSFYAEQGDLIVIPTYYQDAGGSLQIKLDFGLPQGENTLDSSIYKTPSANDSVASTVSYNINDYSYSNRTITKTYILENKDTFPILRITTKGWHTLTVTNTSNKNTAFNGLEFISFETFNLLKSTNKDRLIYYTHSSFSSSDSVTEIRVPDSEIKKLYKFYNTSGAEYWRNPHLRVVIVNYEQGISEYGFLYSNEATKNKFFEVGSYGATSQRRTITNISYDFGNTNDLVITLDSNSPTQKATIVISLY